MARSVTKPEEIMAKLIELTQDGGLVWEVGNYKELSEERIESVFETAYKGTNLRLMVRTYYDPSRSLYFSDSPLAPVVTLEIVSDTINLSSGQARRMALWTFPQHRQLLGDLLNAVKYQVSGAKNFFEDILNDSPTTDGDSK